MNSEPEEGIEALRARLRLVQSECERLQAENARLRELVEACANSPIGAVRSNEKPQPQELSSPESSSTTTSAAAVTNGSPPAAKLNLFRSLFRGREDVYAIRWVARNGRAGYSPACVRDAAFFAAQQARRAAQAGWLNKQRDRKFLPLTDQVVHDHLIGKQTIGVYPLLPDETCWFVAVDFDKGTWQEDALAFTVTCREAGVACALERSRSGKGAHVWIFFDQPAHASLARKLASYLLTRTMEQRRVVGLDSYDRLFPNQDTLPKGGFGNLIALPLQRVSRQEGNSVFVDDNLDPFADQWEFLSRVERVTEDMLDDIVRGAERKGSIIGIPLARDPDDVEPWSLLSTSREAQEPIEGLPGQVRIVRASLIYIEKKDLPAPMLHRLARLAAFQNPEFYRAQAMRLSTFAKPRVISCSEEFPQHIGLPRGCFESVQSLFADHGVVAEIVDERFGGAPIGVSFCGTLKPQQEEAGRALLAHDDGVLCAPTAFGKTAVAAWIIAQRQVNALVLVHRSQLLDQWRERLAVFLGVPVKEIGQIGGGKDRRTGQIDVAMIQALGRKRDVKAFVTEYGHVVVDECHHVSAFTFENVLRQVRAKYVLGVTATPARKDGHHPIIFMQCGPIRLNLNNKKLLDSKIEHRVLPRHTSFAFSPEWRDPTIHDIYSALVLNGERNEMIINDVLQSVSEGRSPLVLTERMDHLQTFETALKDHVQHLLVFKGGMGKKQRESLRRRIEEIPADEQRVILATGKYIGEGFDDSRLDSLFLAFPISWRGTLQQYVGRLHRIHADKRSVRVYDYVDSLVPMLARMYEKRVKGYKSIGYVFDQQANSELKTSEHNAQVERAAVEAVVAFEKARGCEIGSVEDDTAGFDLISRRIVSNNPPTVAEVRFIEVKGRAGIGGVSLTANQYRAAKRLKSDYWLYVVFNCAGKPEIRLIQNPARLEWKPVKKVEEYHIGAEALIV